MWVKLSNNMVASYNVMFVVLGLVEFFPNKRGPWNSFSGKLSDVKL